MKRQFVNVVNEEYAGSMSFFYRKDQRRVENHDVKNLSIVG